MADIPRSEAVLTVRNLQDFFRMSLEEAVQRQGVSIQPATSHYVVNLMTLFARSEALYEHDGECYGLRPLALMLADASDADTPEARGQHLQRIGDVSLFVSGFFSDSLADRAVDVDYYIRMGGSAYGSLSDELRGTFRGNAFGDIYRELSVKFTQVVDLLNDVRDGGTDRSQDLERIYDVWRKTGSARARAQLEAFGVTPMHPGRGGRRH